MQSKEHTLPSPGMRFTPSETPNRRECTGPKMGDGYIMVDMYLSVFEYKGSNNCRNGQKKVEVLPPRAINGKVWSFITRKKRTFEVMKTTIVDMMVETNERK